MRRGSVQYARRRGGFSLMEVMLVLTIIGILVAMSAPSFRRSVEQSHADIAGANLRAIWAAQRLYWLENHTYSDNLADLETQRLIDPAIVTSTTRYVYAIDSADNTTFTVAATRTGSERWTGQFTIDQEGTLAGVIQAPGEADITPGFQ